MLFLKWAKWLVNNSVSLLAIPFTVLAIIVSLHTDLFKETSKDKKVSEYFKISTFYNLFEAQKLQKRENFPKSFIYVEDSTKYSHLLFIDRTLSTENSEVEKSLSNLKKFVLDTLSHKNDKFLNKPTDCNLKNIVLHYFLQNLLPDNESPHKVNKLSVCFFNGKDCESYKFYKSEGSEYNTDAILNFRTQKGKEEEKEKEIRNLLGILLKEKLYKKEINQKSDFKTLFKTIHAKCNISEFKNEKVIVTIISDFDHDFDNTNDKQWNRIINGYFKREILNTNDFRQYNLIVFPTSLERKQNADRLLNILKDNTSTNNNIINLSLDDFYDNNLDKFEKENFKNRIRASFYSIKNSNTDTLKFYYPKENSLGLKIASAKIQYNRIKTWRIVTENPLEESNRIFNYEINNQKCNGKINGDFINNTTNADSLSIEIKYNPKIDTEKYRIEIVTTEGNIISYPIEFKEYMQGSLPGFGKWLLDIFCIILIVILISLTIVLSDIICRYINGTAIPATMTKRRTESIFLSIFVFASIAAILIFLMGFWHPVFPLITLITTFVCFIINLLIAFFS